MNNSFTLFGLVILQGIGIFELAGNTTKQIL
jgi:hypothetical protein